MLSYDFFLDLAIILLSTKLFGLLTRRVQMPQVVGALLAGVILGPTFLNILEETEFINKMAELGVILLMFTAGMETDVKELKRTGKASFIIAIFGVGVPLIGGFLAAALFAGDFAEMSKLDLLQNIFIGVILTATSVSITVETLREMGKLKSKSGTAILGAAVIDDILGIIILTFVISFRDSSVSILSIFMRISLFFVFAAVCAVVFYKGFKYMTRKYGRKRRIPIYSFILCLILAYVAEEYFGIADITGAYLAGVIISNLKSNEYVAEKVEITSYMLFSPIFFASIGIKTSIHSMSWNIVFFSLLLIAVAILTKVIGCGIGARLTGFTKNESLKIGIGMVSRGEVALIVANKGAAVGLIRDEYFAPVIIVVLVTTLITPILLKIVYKEKHEKIHGVTVH
jgi:Kef-type K+ transport system membrane component KefB